MGLCGLVLVIIVTALSLQPVHLAKPPLFTRMQKFIKTEYFEDCDKNIYPMKFVNFTFARNGSDMVINGEEIVVRDIKSPTKVQFVIDKCKDKSNPDTCEYYNTWKWGDLCATFKLPFVRIVVNAFTPPHPCPMKKNHYYIKNAKLSAEFMAMFLAHSDTITLWKFRMQATEDNLPVLCTEFGFRIVNVRVRV